MKKLLIKLTFITLGAIALPFLVLALESVSSSLSEAASEAADSSTLVESSMPPENLNSLPLGATKQLRILYEGILLDKNGVAARDGSYNVIFTIYDKETEGNILWQEEYSNYNAVFVTNNKLKVMLGRENPLNLDLSQAPFWLGIKIGETTESQEINWGEEILPRKKITTLSEFLKDEKNIPENWEELSLLLKEKLKNQSETIILFDIKELAEFEGPQPSESGFVKFFKSFLDFLTEKLIALGEAINKVLEKMDKALVFLADIKDKVDVIYKVLVPEETKDLTSATTLSEPESLIVPPEGLTSSPKDAGRLVIQQGESLIKVSSNFVEENSLIFISFLNEPNDIWWIEEKVAGASFTLRLKNPVPQNLTFDYWILGGANEGIGNEEIPAPIPEPEIPKEEPPIQEEQLEENPSALPEMPVSEPPVSLSEETPNENQLPASETPPTPVEMPLEPSPPPLESPAPLEIPSAQ